VTRFIVVRHGETRWNVGQRIQGHGDSPLTEMGVAQADAVAQRLAGEKFDRIVASDLGRAHETARRIAAVNPHPIELDPSLRERNFGAGEGMSYEEVDRVYPGAFSRVRATDPDFRIPGGESRRDFHQRVVDGVEAIARRHAGETVLLVTHGGVLSTLYRHVHGIPLEAAHAISITNASFNSLTFDGSGWSVDTWNCILHLPGAEPLVDT
jgi:probable phosphoglycerate mutase